MQVTDNLNIRTLNQEIASGISASPDVALAKAGSLQNPRNDGLFQQLNNSTTQ
jgi:hypothetical protein